MVTIFMLRMIMVDVAWFVMTLLGKCLVIKEIKIHNLFCCKKIELSNSCGLEKTSVYLA